MAQYSKSYSLMTVGFSGITSRVVNVADAAELSVSWITVGTSSITIQGANAEGWTEAIPANAWSTVSVLGAQGIYAIQPGMQWLRILQAASTSSNTVTLSKSVR